MEAADRYLEREDFSPEEMDRLVEEALGADAPEPLGADAPETLRGDAPESLKRGAPNPLRPEELDRMWEQIRQRSQRDRLYRRYRPMKVACVLLVVLFLASDESVAINGCDIPCDGGAVACRGKPAFSGV